MYRSLRDVGILFSYFGSGGTLDCPGSEVTTIATFINFISNRDWILWLTFPFSGKENKLPIRFE